MLKLWEVQLRDVSERATMEDSAADQAKGREGQESEGDGGKPVQEVWIRRKPQRMG